MTELSVCNILYEGDDIQADSHLSLTKLHLKPTILSYTSHSARKQKMTTKHGKPFPALSTFTCVVLIKN